MFARLPPAQYQTGWVLCCVGRAYFEMVDYPQVGAGRGGGMAVACGARSSTWASPASQLGPPPPPTPTPSLQRPHAASPGAARWTPIASRGWSCTPRWV